MTEARKQIDELERKISCARMELETLEEHSALPGEFQAFLDERGYFAALRNLERGDRKACSQMIRSLELLVCVNRNLQRHRENLIRSCGSVHDGWGPLSDRWDFLLQEAGAMKEGRIAFEKYAEEVRSKAEPLIAELSGPIEELVKSIERGEMAMADNRETVEMRLRELQSEIAACEEKREKLVLKLRTERQVGG